MVADRFGTVRASLCAGALMYALGLVLMANANTAPLLDLSAGVLIGFALRQHLVHRCAVRVRQLPPLMRSLAFGLATAAGSFGQFLFSPVAVGLMDAVGWQQTLVVFGITTLLMLPLSLALMRRRPRPSRSGVAVAAAGTARSVRAPLVPAAGARLLHLRLPARLHHRAFAGLSGRSWTSTRIGGWTIASIGLFNIIGSITAGWLGSRLPKRYLLSFIYFMRAAIILAFISFPVTPFTCIAFGASMGLMWLSTVPLTNGLVALMFGTQWLTTLAGFAFFSHQVGGFLGVWLGGFVFARTGSYDMVWWLAILFGILSALINMPIVERPVARAVAIPA